ncbi:sodium:solute symporter family protein [Nocardia pseudobrasiliensis]|uniref:SSS family solute:Na+ symporter n=1 Tax=Nocardia pseudobrasiliensis TaxID=45979 RepID=A0A370I0H3_9NOCA|nr:sodium:solute symporter family protein [Nocardia pseudobrasiliensis]RDI64228.1 SSS family solute:Na+ symporter [Nocardia pseudobrasiliensis]
MNTTLAVALAGMVVVAAVGLLGRRRPAADLAEWSVAGRRFGAVTMWFLQAGETYTTFTFLGLAGLAFTGGVAATYAIPYIPLACLVWYFIGPRLWRLGRRHNYLTQADFYEERYRSKALGTLVAVCSVVFMLPYLQLQITGLGLIIRLVTHDRGSGIWAMVVGTVLTAAFVLWAGIRGTAATSYLKDALMLAAVAIVVVAVPLHVSGGLGRAFREVARAHPAMLTLHAGPTDQVWWFTSMLASFLGSAFFTLPALWPALLSARSVTSLRRNWMMLPVYQLTLVLPMAIGFVAIVALPKGTSGDGVLLTLAGQAVPDWLLGLIAVAGASAAMVPASVMVLAMSSNIVRNVIRVGDARAQIRINHVVVLIILASALGMELVRPNALANLLLITFSGLVQFAPGLIAGLAERPWLGRAAVIWGIVAGEGFAVWAAFWKVDLAHVNAGLPALGLNIAVAVVVEAVTRIPRRGRSEAMEDELAVSSLP